MPAKIIGMIGTQMEGVAVHLIKGKISREWVIDFTRLHEQWNYDSVLVGYYASFFGGSSDGALEMGAQHCDVFAIFGEPLAETRARVDDFRRRAAVFGRRADFNMSLRPIMAETEGAAWDKAHSLLADVERKTGEAPKPSNHSSERLLGYAARADVHDERLWMGIARATGAPGNTSCLVGTPEQIAAAVLKYYRLGIRSFLLRGFENPHDTMAIGRDLIPLIKQ